MNKLGKYGRRWLVLKNEFNYSLRVLIAEIKRQGETDLKTIGRFALTEESKEIVLFLYRLILKTCYFKDDTKKLI